ncbi:MAG: ImmA/IrrE family metallo-endopeptidase [Treponema sp.]|nr:ImmA/IrrE family metallo-endopeptidase [Treponema sp.]
MLEIDDFYVINDTSDFDLNKAIENYKYFRNAKIPEIHLKKHFSALAVNDQNILYKKKEIANNPLQKYWTLRFIEMAEKNVSNIPKTNKLSLEKSDLQKIAKLSICDDRINRVKKFLKERGIYLYFIDSLPGTNIDGSVFCTSNDSIVIGLTVRYERLDNLWFTLLHELSHVVLHENYLKEGGHISFDKSQDIKEIEANRLAKDSIISPEKYRACIPKRTRDVNDLLIFADNNNIHPALLAGLIRNDLNDYMIFSEIIVNAKIERSKLYD